ncbi:hypothetical protein DFS33DRAFT_744191 [Desarmillaria ectypa]|nr:hypothetical protein DFS33DRAFT_744191 [Desarmillaria ectypa]
MRHGLSPHDYILRRTRRTNSALNATRSREWYHEIKHTSRRKCFFYSTTENLPLLTSAQPDSLSLHTFQDISVHTSASVLTDVLRSDVLNRHIKTCKAINRSPGPFVVPARCLVGPAPRRKSNAIWRNLARNAPPTARTMYPYNPDTALTAPSESSASSPTDFPFVGSARDPTNDLVLSLGALADALLFLACTPSQSGWLEGDGGSEGYGLFVEHRLSLHPNEACADTELSAAGKQHYLL